MFKLFRPFFTISLIGIVATTALLTLFYRQVTIRTTANLSQANSMALAQTTLISVRPELDEYLAADSGAGAHEFAAQPLAGRLNVVLKELMRDSLGLVVRVNLFNRRGIVIFSTDRAQIGQNHANSPGFMSAINGHVASNLSYRDIFNVLGSETEAANLMETYIPVRSGAANSVDAVFESYIDVSPLVAQNQRAVLIVLAVVGLLLSVLYGTLVLVVRRALRAIESQQANISERTTALEMLSARMLSSDETDKKKLAFGLHEGLAQTLVTIKLRLEHRLNQIAASKAQDESLESIIPVLQNAIQDVQSIATGLRPSSLDDLGLLATLHWYCREFERQHPAIAVAEEISAQEDDVPGALKIVIYRVIESVFSNIASGGNTGQIELSLQAEDGAIRLAIDDIRRDPRSTPDAEHDSDSDLHARFAEAQERTTLSGGNFTIARSKSGEVMLRASWRA